MAEAEGGHADESIGVGSGEGRIERSRVVEITPHDIGTCGANSLRAHLGARGPDHVVAVGPQLAEHEPTGESTSADDENPHHASAPLIAVAMTSR